MQNYHHYHCFDWFQNVKAQLRVIADLCIKIKIQIAEQKYLPTMAIRTDAFLEVI